MPPAVGGHYRPNISNPFNQFPPAQNNHPTTHHYGHQPSLSNFNTQTFGTGGGFPAPAGHLNNGIFGSGFANGGGSFGGGVGSTGGETGLGSREAQARFARGAAMQEQQGTMQVDSLAGGMVRAPIRVREVWRGNLLQEMAVIRGLIDKYPYISMDTEFPGVVARPMGNFPSKADYHFQCLRCNVDLLKLIQLGITLFTADGELPPAQPDSSMARGYPNNLVACPCTWTFNFQFSLTEDMYSQDSIDMLQKAGVDFAKCEEMGINTKEFGSLLITSGLVLDADITWLSFHSGYDFGYLVKMMAGTQLPQDEEEYLKIVRTWFPRIYDVKFLLLDARRSNTRGILNQQASSIMNALGGRSGLQDLADELGCPREGRAHTAGSDAWLTGAVFWAMKEKMFDNHISDELIGMIWGLSGVGPPAPAASQAAALAGNQTPNTNGASLYHTEMTPSTMRDTPSTPQTTHSGLPNNTPGPHGYSSGMAGLTGGAFSGFQYSRDDNRPRHLNAPALPDFRFPDFNLQREIIDRHARDDGPQALPQPKLQPPPPGFRSLEPPQPEHPLEHDYLPVLQPWSRARVEDFANTELPTLPYAPNPQYGPSRAYPGLHPTYNGPHYRPALTEAEIAEARAANVRAFDMRASGGVPRRPYHEQSQSDPPPLSSTSHFPPLMQAPNSEGRNGSRRHRAAAQDGIYGMYAAPYGPARGASSGPKKADGRGRGWQQPHR